jgi:hypothetical protein
LREPPITGGVEPMGAKYLPSARDLKAYQRFQQKENPLPKFKKPRAAQPAKRKKK